VDLQARDAFFAFWVTSKCWNFLIPYAHPTDCPEALTLAIEAVSLAYLWHQVGSNAALVNAREKYVLALRRTNKVLRIPNEAAKETSLLACLLLDLFEKITELAPRRNRAWSSHVNGALALVQLRGLESFQNPSDFSILARLTSNSLMSCVCSGSPVPVGLMEIQEYIGEHLDAQVPKNQLSEIMIQYASLKYEAQRNGSSNEEYIRGATELNTKLSILDLELPKRWLFSSTYLSHYSERIFGFRYDFYPTPGVCFARNLLRGLRILLLESLREHCLVASMASIYL
jgi:hypothetical protein